MKIEAAAPALPVHTASKSSASTAPIALYSPARSTPLTAIAVVVDSIQEMTNSAATTTAAPDDEVEAKLSAEIAVLYGNQRAGKATVRRTRVELKALRQQLGERLFAMKAILVGSGRGGGWAPFLRKQKLPLATSDRLVAAHQARLAPMEEKLLTEELPEPTVDQVRQFTERLLPKLCRMLTTQQSVYEFVRDVIMQISVADGRSTEAGFEILKQTATADAGCLPQDSTTSTPPPPEVPQRSNLIRLHSQSTQ